KDTEYSMENASKPGGILKKAEIIEGLSEGGKDASVSGSMRPTFLVVRPDLRLSDFFQMALEKGQNVAVVMDGDKLIGLIDRENMEEKLLVKQALMNKNHGH